MTTYAVTVDEGLSGSTGAKPWGQMRADAVGFDGDAGGGSGVKPWGQLRALLLAAIEDATTIAILRAWTSPRTMVVSTAEGATTVAMLRWLGQVRTAVVSTAEGAVGSALSRDVLVSTSEGAAGEIAVGPWAELRSFVLGAEASSGIAADRIFATVHTAAVGTAEGFGPASTVKPFGQLRVPATADPDVFVAIQCARAVVVSSVENAAGILATPPLTRYYLDARGLYRIFNAAEYRFYRSTLAPPVEGSTPFATSSSLPATPAETFSDGAWYLSVSYFNGVLDSGFLPLGPAGETYLLLTVADGADAGQAPAGPLDWQLEPATGGVVRVVAIVLVPSPEPLIPLQWSIAYTTDGTDPPIDTPDISQEMPAAGLAVLGYDLPAAADGATVKVRLQVRRNEGTVEEPAWTYSANSTVQSATADAVGPSAPIAADRWAGALPTEQE